MPKRAANDRRGITGGAGRKSSVGAKKGIGGDGTTTEQLGMQQAPRQGRSAGNMANLGNSLLKQPAARKHNYN